MVKLPPAKRSKPAAEPSTPVSSLAAKPEANSLDDFYRPPEIDRIVGKRIRENSRTESVLKFKDVKKKMWEPAENKDIQLLIAEYEAGLIKSKVKSLIKNEQLDESEQQLNVNTSLVEEVAKESNLKRINIEIFGNDDHVLVKDGEGSFIQLDIHQLDKRELCKAIINVLPSVHLKK